jgi:molybdopterin-guanine dinucleotide biosynthesis protein A
MVAKAATSSITTHLNHKKEGLEMLGIVLAGGQSQRFGQDKARYQLANQPLNNVGLAAAKLQLLCEHVIVSANANNFSALAAQFASDQHVTVTRDQAPFVQQGPLSGIYAATCLSPELTDYLLLAVDYPLMTTTILTNLTTAANCYAATPTRDHYLVSHFQTSQAIVRDDLLLGDLRVSHFMTATCQAVPITFPASRALINLNKLEALTDVN